MATLRTREGTGDVIHDMDEQSALIGRRIEVTADLDRVRAFCEGQVVAAHQRSWAWHQLFTNPAHPGRRGGAAPPAGHGAANTQRTA